jgi:hypothetical protein
LAHNRISLPKAQWIPDPLGHCAEIFGFISPKEISSILLTLWNVIRDIPPTVASYEVDTQTQRISRAFQWPEHQTLETYMHPIKQTLRQNIERLGCFYSRFLLPNEN